MESFSGDTEESTEDLPGKKKSKLKSLKTRLFGRTKRADGEESAKLSQSASDITAGKGLGSEEDLVCSQGMLGSRALSHDSIFLADQVLSDAEPDRVLSQENVHSKIKTLQMKLQQQKMHLGPPPLVLPIKRPDDLGSRSEADGLPHSPPEILRGDVSTQAALSKAISQPSSRPLSPIPKPAPTRSVPLTPSLSSPLSALSTSPPTVAAPALDFSSPAQFTPCLDTSAARHRMAIKPRKQRASTKGKRLATDSRPLSNILNNIDHPVSEKQEEQELAAEEEITRLRSHSTQILETGQGGVSIPVTSQCLPVKSPEPAPITSEPSEAQAAPKSSSPTLSHRPTRQDLTLPGRAPSVASQVLGVKPHRPVDVMISQQPQTDLKEKREGSGDFEIQAMSHDKRDTISKAGMIDRKSNREQGSQDISVPSNQHSASLGSVAAFRSSSLRQQVQAQTEDTGGIKRPGSGSFHFSVTTAKCRDGERPRSGSFLGVVEQAGARLKTGGGPEVKSTPREEGALHKGPVLPWDRRDSLKKGEPVIPSKQAAMETGALEGEEVEDSQEAVEDALEAKEVQEEEEKTTFGVKLRSTSLSLKFRSDAGAAQSDSKVKRHSAEMGSLIPPLAPYSRPSKSVEEQCNKRKGEEIGDNASYMSKKLPTNIPCNPTASGHLRQTAADDPHTIPSLDVEAQTISSNPEELETALSAPQEPQTAPQSAPQSASSEVSWMSLAIEKTRSLQQLFSSRLPRDFTSMQTAARPQAQPYRPTYGRPNLPCALLHNWRPHLSLHKGVLLNPLLNLTSPQANNPPPSNPLGTIEVELRKTQSEARTPAETPALPNTTPSSRDTKPEGRQGTGFLSESSPTKVPGRLEDKWLRKNMPSSSSPSSSPTPSSPLQSMSDSGQPSWMELAKRKSMAWSDKTMD
ncbi:CRACD-like protein [Centroberyx affinis]|uniref:CRACD-like protein n=1 Tax=Centroberyx affinis TaxID=166261 RepID=UPI003A5C6E46